MPAIRLSAALIYFTTKANNYNGPLEAAHAHIDDDRYNMVWLNALLMASPHWSSKRSYDDVASVSCIHAIRLSSANLLYPTIANNYNVPLEAAHAHIDDDRYDVYG